MKKSPNFVLLKAGAYAKFWVKVVSILTKKFYLKLRKFNRIKQPVSNRAPMTVFVGSPCFIIYKHVSYIKCVLL